MTGWTPNEKTPPSVRGSVARVTSILAIPYGYTVTLYAAGGLAVARLGSPSVADVFLFVIGACAAFVALAMVGSAHLAPEIPMRVPHLVVFNVLPILAGLAVAMVPLRPLGQPFGYCAASFLATVTYVLSLVGMVRLVSRVQRP